MVRRVRKFERHRWPARPGVKRRAGSGVPQGGTVSSVFTNVPRFADVAARVAYIGALSGRKGRKSENRPAGKPETRRTLTIDLHTGAPPRSYPSRALTNTERDPWGPARAHRLYTDDYRKEGGKKTEKKGIKKKKKESGG